MLDAIASNQDAADELAARVQGSLKGYLGLSLSDLNYIVPVSASGMHDSLSDGIKRALDDWEKLIKADAKAIEDTADKFESSDSALAQELLGM